MIKPRLKSIFLENHNEVFNVPSTIHIKRREKNAQIARSSTIKDPNFRTNYTLPYIKQGLHTSKFLSILPSTPSNLELAYTFMQSSESLSTFKPEVPRVIEETRTEYNKLSSNDQKIQVCETFFKPSSIAYSKSCKSNTISINVTASASRKIYQTSKFKYDDNYIYTKIMKNHDVAPFSELLQMTGDSNVSSYPYFTKVAREIKKIEPVPLRKLIKKPRAHHECSCLSSASRISNKEKPKEEDIKDFCSSISLLSQNEHQVRFVTSFIIINFEGVIGYMDENKLKLRRGAVKFLKSVCDSFNLIILTSNSRIVSTISSVLETKDIAISGLYLIEPRKHKEMAHFARIYNDFHIQSPSTSVLVLASLNIDIAKGDPLFPMTQRVARRLNISVCPVSCEPQPITFLVPHLLLNVSSHPFEIVLNSFKLTNPRPEFNFQDWIKDCRIRFRVVRSTLPYEIVMETMPKKINSKRCRLHNSSITSPEEIPFNYFVLFLD